MFYGGWYVFSPTVLCANNWSRIIDAICVLAAIVSLLIIPISLCPNQKGRAGAGAV